jgi:hypothetical protein
MHSTLSSPEGRQMMMMMMMMNNDLKPVLRLQIDGT